jgi:hypothetical protein
MKTRTLRRLRRALKKRSEPSTRDKQRAQVYAELSRASQHAKDLADRAVNNLTPKEREILDKRLNGTLEQNASAFTRIQSKVSNHFEERAKQAGAEVLTRTTDWTPPPPVHEPALYPVTGAPKPTAGALLAAMLQGKKA